MILKFRVSDGGFQFIEGIDSVRHDAGHYWLHTAQEEVYRAHDDDPDVSLERSEIDTDDRRACPDIVEYDERKGQSGMRRVDLIEQIYETDGTEIATAPWDNRKQYRRLATDLPVYLLTDEGETIEKLV
jgi:hypothetical protein